MTKKNILIIGLILCLFIIFGNYWFSKDNNEKIKYPEINKNLMQKTTVERVIDGDTIVIASGEKVRMILVDSPESVHPDEKRNTVHGDIASNFTRKILYKAIIYLEKDISERDKYGRLLRYVYLEDGICFNELLVKEGYANISIYPPDIKYVDAIREAEKYARKENKGLWEYVE